MTHKLLLADDSVTIQRVIELTFADEDVQVIAVGDGKKAIASIQADRPDIVLADVGMPERDGYEVAAFIKGTAELAHIPVLLLTGAFEPIDETRARAVGCDGVLVKPFEPQMVISRVKDLLAGRKPAGVWAASPAAQTPLRQPAPAAADHAAPPLAGGSLEDYFDRLDAAFASLDGPPGAAPRGGGRAAAVDRVHAAAGFGSAAAGSATLSGSRGVSGSRGGHLATGRSVGLGSQSRRRSEDIRAVRARGDRDRAAARARAGHRAPDRGRAGASCSCSSRSSCSSSGCSCGSRSTSGSGRGSGSGSGSRSRSGFRVHGAASGRRSRGAHAVACGSLRDAAVRRTRPPNRAIGTGRSRRDRPDGGRDRPPRDCPHGRSGRARDRPRCRGTAGSRGNLTDQRGIGGASLVRYHQRLCLLATT